jgi:hypothetical protein
MANQGKFDSRKDKAMAIHGNSKDRKHKALAIEGYCEKTEA